MSFVQVPPDSTGKKVATYEVAGEQQQVVTLADSAGDEIAPLTDAQLRASPIVTLIDSVSTNSVSSGVSGTDNALTTHSIITGETTAGGGGYVNVKVNPSGALAVSVGDSALPTDAATETTLAQLNGKIANTPSGAILSGTAADRFFENFADFDTTNTWEVVQTGTGMAITGPLGGAAAGSSPYLSISSGTTVNQKTIILSRSTFSMPFDLRYQITASQRIANNRCIIGFVQVDDNGNIVTSTSITTAPDVLNARNAVVHQHDGTTATTSQLRVRAAGSALDTFANAFGTGFTTAATGSAPNFLSATTYGLTLERDKINSRAYGQNLTTNTGGQFSYDRILPNPTVRYKLCIIVENLGSAPASSTDWRIHLVNVMDATRFDVSPRNAGSADLAKAFPVVGSVAVTSGTVNVGTVTAITAANLAVPGIIADVASAALTTTTTTAAVTPTFGATYIVNIPVTAVSGTNPTLDIGVEESDDTGTNWYRVYDFPRITATGMYRSPPLTLRGNRVRYVQTVGGTTPSFTRAINRLQRSDDAPLRIQFIDRTIVPNTLNSTSGVFYIEGCRDFNLVARLSAQTTPATITLQVSHDGANWFSLSTTLATVNGIAQAKFTNEQWKFARAIVTAAGTGITLGELTLTGMGA